MPASNTREERKQMGLMSRKTKYLLASLICQLLLLSSISSAQNLGDWFDAVDELELRVTETINDLLGYRHERIRAGEGNMATFTFSVTALPREIAFELAVADNSGLRSDGIEYFRETSAAFQRSGTRADYATQQRVLAAYYMISAADDIYLAVMNDASSETFDLRVALFRLWGMNRQMWSMWQ